MSCEVKTFASIADLKKVQELFGFAQDENWLNAVYYSISPTGEVLAFAHGSKFVILSSNWSGSSSKHSHFYSISFSGELENPNEIITSIICLPIYGEYAVGGVDWTCIALGLASGLVVFYSDLGVQVFSQRWHQEAVQSLKCESTQSPHEELHVGYLSCVCILPGGNLFGVLKALKQNLSNNLTSRSASSNAMRVPDTVECRKWEYRTKSAGSINDSVVVGPQRTGDFDHMLEQSLTNGFHTRVRSAPPQNALVLGVGVKPYVGFYYAEEGFVPPVWGDFAKIATNYLLSPLPGWLYKSSSQPPAESEPQIPPGKPMVCRFGICDIQRQAIQIWLSPTKELAAVADNLGRVILVDCLRGVALRVWKGYRDAQCAFIKVKEKTLKGDKSEKRRALFLVIYAPRRACIEIWALQNGPKIAAFTVSKNGQLLYNTHGLMAIRPGARPKTMKNACLFMDPTDDSIKEILVPFHCALSDKNSKTAKDVHLLRRMKTILRNDALPLEDTVAEIHSLCANLQTDEVRLQCVEMLAKHKKVRPIVFKTAMAALQEPTDELHRNALANYYKLAQFYIALKECDLLQTNLSSEQLSLSENDLETIQKLLDLTEEQRRSHNTQSKVTFSSRTNDNGDFIEFLNVFHVDAPYLALNAAKSSLFGFIGGILFDSFLERGQDVRVFVDAARESSICSENLLSLVMSNWLEKDFSYNKSEEVIEDMVRLAALVQAICDVADDKIHYNYNAICDWWQSIRELLLESPCALRGLLAAIVCRNISLAQQRKAKDDSCDEVSQHEDEIWEQVSHEAAQWTLIIGKLDDISVLGAILGYPILSIEPSMPSISYEKPDCSLKSILCSGKGIVTELTAKWLVHSQVHPTKIIEAPKIREQSDDDTASLVEEAPLDLIIQNLHHLREHFPFSLESGLLLSQMVWEYMSHWSKNLSSLEYLKGGLTCLAAFKPEDQALKHGVCCMVWNAHLKIPLEATKKLIHKAGRLPKEKLCQQDIEMSFSAVSDFLEHCIEFLDHFLSSLECEKRELKFEEILTDNQIPLQFLALQQNHAIKTIVQLHIELCLVLHLIAFFQLKTVKPITFVFDPMANQTFFVEVNRELQYVLPNPDMVLQRQRDEFLCKAITASTELIREDLESLYTAEHEHYVKKIHDLADMWKLDKKGILRHEVVEIYAKGWDSYAELLLKQIADDERLGPLLLEIAGRRLNLYTSTSQGAFLKVASVGPQLLNYLDNLKEKQGGVQISASTPEEVDLRPLTTLTAKAFECLSKKESKHLHISGQMYDACVLLQSD